MRKIFLSLALTLAVGSVAASTALAHGTLVRRPLTFLCQLRHRVSAAEFRAHGAALCKDRALIRRQAQRHNVVYGNCGWAYMWINGTPWQGYGWISEDYGVWDDYGIYAGSAVIHSYNFTHGKFWSHLDYIWPNHNPYEWQGHSYEYVMNGNVGVWLLDTVEGTLGQICGDAGSEPFDLAWLPQG